MNCPGFEKLIDFFDDRLSASEASSVSSHLALGCANCSETRDWYQKVRQIATSDNSVAPPPWVLKRAVRIFEARQHRASMRGRIGQAIATLVFDSFARPALSGVRSTETANRQLLYTAGDYSLDLQIIGGQQSHVDLIGQVLKEGETDFESVTGLNLSLAREGKSQRTTVTDQMGEFKISAIDQGLYELQVQLSEGSITIRDLPISQS